jgi:hypothetical protein
MAGVEAKKKVLNKIKEYEKEGINIYATELMNLNSSNLEDDLLMLEISNKIGGPIFVGAYTREILDAIVDLSNDKKIWFKRLDNPSDEMDLMYRRTNHPLLRSPLDLLDDKSYWLIMSVHTKYEQGMGYFVRTGPEETRFLWT